MENLPVDVHIVPDGQEAIDFIAKAGSEPDAPCPHFLLLDLNLPKVDGFGVLRRLRASERLKAIPVLVITSSDSPGDRRRAAELGAGYFRKTPSYEDFLKLGGVLKLTAHRQRLALTDCWRFSEHLLESLDNRQNCAPFETLSAAGRCRGRRCRLLRVSLTNRMLILI